MTAYIIRRLLLVVPTLLGIMLINFAVVQIVPGGPVEQLIAQMTGTAVESTARFSGGGEGENLNSINVGCIPSKSLLNTSEMYHKAQKEFKNLGIDATDIKLNLPRMMANKNKSILTLTKGVEFLFKKNNIGSTV